MVSKPSDEAAMPSETAAVSPFELNNRNAQSVRSHEVAETRTSRGRRRSTASRYRGGKNAVTQNARVSSANIEIDIATGSVADPWGEGEIAVQINRRVDILENEKSRRRINEAEYRIGRMIQQAFEGLDLLHGASLAGGGSGGGNPQQASDLRSVRIMERGRELQKIMRRVVARIGMVDTRLLRQVIGDRLSFEQCAVSRGQRVTPQNVNFIGRRFREALGELAKEWTARGAIQALDDDKHVVAAAAAVSRQRLSMDLGVTTERRRQEDEAAPKRRAAEEARRQREANPARRQRT